jgi:copper(I)-binding protein
MSIQKLFSIVSLGAALMLSACGSPMQSAPAASDAVVNAQIGDLTIRGAWARPTVATAAGDHNAHAHSADSKTTPMNSAAYMIIENTGASADRLIDVAGDVAQMVQLHQTTMTDGLMKMQHLPAGAEIPAGGSLILKPASYHVMFMGVQQNMAPGSTVKITLTFERAGSVTIDVPVREP